MVSRSGKGARGKLEPLGALGMAALLAFAALETARASLWALLAALAPVCIGAAGTVARCLKEPSRDFALMHPRWYERQTMAGKPERVRTQCLMSRDLPFPPRCEEWRRYTIFQMQYDLNWRKRVNSRSPSTP